LLSLAAFVVKVECSFWCLGKFKDEN